MPEFDGAVLHGIEDLQAGNDFAGGKGLELEFIIGGFADRLGHLLGAAMQRIQRLRPACRHAPFDLRHRLRNRRRGDGGSTCDTQTCDLDKVSSFHRIPHLAMRRWPSLRGLGQAWSIRFGISMMNWRPAMQKPGLLAETGLGRVAWGLISRACANGS